jgi:hypothetical protein
VSYLLPGLELLAVEAVEQEGEEEVEHHEVSHDERREEDGEARLGHALLNEGSDRTRSASAQRLAYPFLLGAHAIPQRLHPFAAKDAKYHHERMEEVGEIPSAEERETTCKLLP